MRDESLTKKINCVMDDLIIEMKVEGLKLLKIELTKPLLTGRVSDIPSEILKNLHELAAKYGLHLKSSTTYKKSEMIFQFNLDGYISQEESWSSKLKRDLTKIKEAMDEIEKNPYFCQIKKTK